MTEEQADQAIRVLKDINGTLNVISLVIVIGAVMICVIMTTIR